MSSFSVLNDVDEQTSKTILGSDGAARWQDFRSGSKIKATTSVAPAIPLKKLDRALGTKSISDERATEARIRKDAGDRELHAGYTDFRRKNDHEENAAQKKRKLIVDRVRPDDMPYFLPAETFEGFKFDYVFTTKSRGTGYYWDGWDSMKRELGEDKPDANNDTSDTLVTAEDDVNSEQIGQVNPKVKKKKKKRKLQETIIESDQWNPMEQVNIALRRKQAALNASAPTQRREVSVSDAVALGASSNELKSTAKEALTESEALPSGWECANDPNSGKTYYFCRTTAERSWTKPVLIDELPAGWKSAKDPNSSKIYYHHSDGRTSWTKPTE
eukprot:CAMPEP_0113390026 /NCGR_PEP_ID=MMETSP0013_2-20120614/9947_1 /TAXON_ID=2843 ORGANISM="Skeletonema costatum, Strain 1716" /NCGR_SAMPLE_ID=MMETSP0013_2 /ASSEMBLY_ACC=CAM_ASM_000158 /LENGTH=329 /DNA_ID=CAMNT_0000273155 /DNA_START=158 /DNA_END=1147 /DNA_ORIENTATION=+ /assembly_acc=CAM_ASM_000158